MQNIISEMNNMPHHDIYIAVVYTQNCSKLIAILTYSERLPCSQQFVQTSFSPCEDQSQTGVKNCKIFMYANTALFDQSSIKKYVQHNNVRQFQ